MMVLMQVHPVEMDSLQSLLRPLASNYIQIPLEPHKIFPRFGPMVEL